MASRKPVEEIKTIANLGLLDYEVLKIAAPTLAKIIMVATR